MGCGSSRSPVRVGILSEDDEDFYPELMSPLVDSWVRESVCDSPSYCPTSPPPYTPLPLSGHVTLMLSSPAKRQASVTDDDGGPTCSQRDDTNPITATSDRRRSVVSEHQDEIVLQREVLSASPPRPDFNSSHSSAEIRALQQTQQQRRTSDVAPPLEEGPLSTASPTSTAAIDVPIARSASADPDSIILPHCSSQHALERVKLSSSFPSVRPPSPFPCTRSLSTCLPPLTRVQLPDDRRPATSALTHELYEQYTPFRLPPLALQRQQSLDSGSSDSHGHHRKKRLHVRSRSCQTQTSGLSSVQENNIPITN